FQAGSRCLKPDLASFAENSRISGRAGPEYTSLVVSVGLAERKRGPSVKATKGAGSRVRPTGSRCCTSQPLFLRWKSVQRQLFKGLDCFSVSRPLAKTSLPMRARQV